jgi:hypothetical protein
MGAMQAPLRATMARRLPCEIWARIRRRPHSVGTLPNPPQAGGHQPFGAGERRCGNRAACPRAADSRHTAGVGVIVPQRRSRPAASRDHPSPPGVAAEVKAHEFPSIGHGRGHWVRWEKENEGGTTA